MIQPGNSSALDDYELATLAASRRTTVWDHCGLDIIDRAGLTAYFDFRSGPVAKVLRFLRTSWRGGLRDLDLAPDRGPGRRAQLYPIARAVGRIQLTVFQRIGRIEREWDAPFVAC